MATAGRTLLILLLGLYVAGCDSDSNEEDSILGIWSLHETDEGAQVGDVQYLHLETDRLTNYDYMGDDFDEGPDCYLIDSFALEHLSGDRYLLSSDEVPGFGIQLNLRVRGNELIVESSPINATYRRSDRQAAEFTPECDDEVFMASGRPPLLQAK